MVRGGQNQYTLTKLPQILIISLNRYTWDTSQDIQENKKNTTAVEFKEPALFLENGNNVAYTLTSLIVHKGDYMASGHYISYYRHKRSWWKSDDRVVSLSSQGDVDCETGAIMFFYERASSR